MLKELHETILDCSIHGPTSDHQLWDFARCLTMIQDAQFSACSISDAASPQNCDPMPLVAAVARELGLMCQSWGSTCCAKKRRLLHCSTRSKTRGKMRAMKVAAAQSGPRECQSKTESPTATVQGAMLSFGFSGGMDPTGTSLASNTWYCVGAYLTSLRVEWAFAVGCRRPAGLQVQEALPGCPYMVDGHASMDYDAVALLHVPSLNQVLQWLPDVSNTSRTCWVVLGGLEFWSCVYIPPQSSASKEEHLTLVSMYFAEWDKVDALRSRQVKSGPRPLIHGCGDLNMSCDIHAAFVENMVRRSICWCSDTSVPTHVKGGVLDFVWGEASSYMLSPVLHDGDHCRMVGCANPACGDLPSLLGNDDLDHFAWVFRCSLMAPDRSCVFGATFCKDVDAWTVASCALLDDILDSLQCEVRLAQFPALLWQIAWIDWPLCGIP